MNLGNLASLPYFLPEFAVRCVDGLRADAERCAAYFEMTPALATVLNPVIGYLEAAEVAKAAQQEGKSIRDVIVERGILDAEEVDRLLAPENLCDALEGTDGADEGSDG